MLGRLLKISFITKTNIAYYLRIFIFFIFKVKKAITSLFHIKKIKEQCLHILQNCDYEVIDIFCFRFGWNAGSFQRAQHIALNLAKNKTLVLYAKNPLRDKDNEFFKNIAENLYLINIDDPILIHILKKSIKNIKKKKIVHNCSTNLFITSRYLNAYKKDGFTLLYEYIDEISHEISGAKIPDSFFKMHDDIIKDTSNIVVSSAQILYDKVYKVRGSKNHILAINGVEYEHWQVPKDSYKNFADINAVVEMSKPIIGYFGALANWFDYDLLGFVAVHRPQYNFVLLGWDYDNSFANSKIEKLPNVHFLGLKKYAELSSYIQAFDCCIIPFKVNDITLSTSPVKLFEYLAAGKPSVCTAMPECVKVEGVFIGNTYEEFLEKTDEAISKKNDEEFIKTLKQKAHENAWNFKVLDMLKVVKK